MPQNDFEGRVYLVTGAGHRPGIGSAVVEKLVQQNACVIVNSRNFDLDWQSRLQESSQVCLVSGDIGRSDIQKLIINRALERWARLDGIVNNASTGAAEFDSSGLLTRHTWQENFLVNCTAVYELCMRCRQYLSASQGSIVNIASRAATKAGSGNNLAYAVSKAALVRLTQELALQFGPDITVNTVSPGLVASTRIQNIMGANYENLVKSWQQISRLDAPIPADHIAGTVLHCLSSRSMTGQNITVCGSAAL